MEKENWIKKIQRKRTERKVKKLRVQFSFLLDEYNNSMKQINAALDKRIGVLSSELNTDKSCMENLLLDNLRKIENINEENVKNYENIKASFSEIVTICDKKLSDSVENVKNNLDNNCSTIHNAIIKSQEQKNNEYQDIIKVLQSISTQLELIQSKVNGFSDVTRTIMDEKISAIELSIDEVKTLMKVVAVNNLLEEI